MTKKNTKAVVPVKKYTLADLKPVQTRISIDHPKHGDVGCWLDVLPPQSEQYMNAFFKAGEADMDKMSLVEKYKVNAQIPAAVVVGWNEDFFGKECTPENITEVLSEIGNSWVLFTLLKELEKPDNFYKKD